MAREKANTVASQQCGHFILSADTAVTCGRQILPKAETIEEATRCLELLSGRSHRVYGGICLYLPNGQYRINLSVSRVKFRSLGVRDKQAYLHSGEVAGGKPGGMLFKVGRVYISVR